MNTINKLLGIGLLSLTASSTQAEVVNMNTWEQYGNPNAGNWSVAADGYSVIQTLNSSPTYFMGMESYINAEFVGSFSVETTSDDDFIGFVFGFNDLDDYYLFDWKQSNQGAGKAGFYLSKITGTDVNLWDHTGNDLEVLASDFSAGWEDNTTYQYGLGYTNGSIAVSIDGGDFDNQEIFNLIGLDNSEGRFGFYNYSQGGVRYVGSNGEACISLCGTSESLALQTVPTPASLGLLGLAMAGFSFRRKS